MESVIRIDLGQDKGMYVVSGLGSLPEIAILTQPSREQILLNSVTKEIELFLSNLTKDWTYYNKLLTKRDLLFRRFPELTKY